MEASLFAFEIIPADPHHPVAIGLLQEADTLPSPRIVLFFSLTFSFVAHLMLLAFRFR